MTKAPRHSLTVHRGRDIEPQKPQDATTHLTPTRAHLEDQRGQPDQREPEKHHPRQLDDTYRNTDQPECDTCRPMVQTSPPRSQPGGFWLMTALVWSCAFWLLVALGLTALL